jgi:DNA (cytosine-5)-methyltransferase 1
VIGSLCTGYGGLDLAAETLTGQPLAWVADNDPAAVRILAARYPAVPNLGDITLIAWEQAEPVDILTAGYPCQPFSQAGKRRGAGDERHLWPEVARAIGLLRPRHVILENVAGHLRLGFADVLADLAALGFNARWGIVRASDAGAPHQRARLFVVAADTANHGRERGRGTRRRRAGPADSGLRPAADTDGAGLERRSALPERRGERPTGPDGVAIPADADCDGPQGVQRVDTVRRDIDRRDHPRTDWGAYEPAIRRWEQTTGRPAPAPTELARTGNPRLSPAFVEWLMGLPEGWVTDIDISRNAQLKALGNGVVPQQAVLALRMLREAA